MLEEITLKDVFNVWNTTSLKKNYNIQGGPKKVYGSNLWFKIFCED